MGKTSTYKPISYAGMNVEVDIKGIQAKNYTFDVETVKKQKPWEAEWIWLDMGRYPEYQESACTVFCSGEGKKHGIALFRKEFDIGREIKCITVWVSADVKYRLYVNGEIAGRGPAEAGGDYGNTEPLNYWFYDHYDFTGLIKEGRNVIAAEVVLQPDVQADYSMGHGGFLFEAEIEYADGSCGLIKTDETWRGILNNASVPINRYDANKEPVGWAEQGFNDTCWPFAGVVCTAAGGRWNLVPREIPPLMEARILPVRVMNLSEEFNKRIQNSSSLIEGGKSPAVIPFGAPFTFWLDFGKVLVGRIYFKVKGAAGTVMNIAVQEIPGKSGSIETYIFRDGGQEYESIRIYSIQYMQVTVFNLTGPLEIMNIGVNFTSYPVSYMGDFKCSDELINNIYNAGRWSLQLCMQAYHMDSPVHQEALGCTGDYMIESLMNYYTFGDKWLTRLDILRTARLLEQKKGYMFHTSYSLLWIEMLVDYYRYTGDDSLFKETAETVHVLLKRFESYRGDAGLIENAPNYMFMDWVPVQEYNLHHPPKTMGQAYMNAFYIKALENGGLICRILGDESNVAYYGKLEEDVRNAFNKAFWDEQKGLYCDGKNSIKPTLPNQWLPADAEGTFFSQHTNSLAVLYDIAPEERREEIMRRVLEDDTLIKAQPYFMHFVLEAAGHAGLFGKYGLNQIRRWEKLLDENPSSLKEVWEGFDCDYSHAWGGTPTYQLPSKVLGVTPLQPGFDVIGIKPVFGDLKWAEGNIPTPKGIVYVGWLNNPYTLNMEIAIPQGCSAIVSIPMYKERNDRLSANGETVWRYGTFIQNNLGIKSLSEDKDIINLYVSSGTYCLVYENR